MALTDKIKKLSRARAKTIDDLTKELFTLIGQGEDDLYKAIIRQYLVKELSVFENGKLKNSAGNYASTFQLDKIWKKVFTQKTAGKILDQIIKGTDQLNKVNVNYFDLFDGDAVKKISDRIQKKILANYGIGTDGKIKPESVLNNTLGATDPINKVKGLIHQAIASEATLADLEASVKITVVDDGLIKRYLDSNSVTNIYDRYDRQTTKEYGDALGLDYAIYQGGLIEDSRDFCIERNGKVFSRDEIAKFGTSKDKFGGYTNKSNGEFQGKWRPGLKIYDPFTDMGCYNCRHHWDWISYELAASLRPDIKKKT